MIEATRLEAEHDAWLCLAVLCETGELVQGDTGLELGVKIHAPFIFYPNGLCMMIESVGAHQDEAVEVALEERFFDNAPAQRYAAAWCWPLDEDGWRRDRAGFCRKMAALCEEDIRAQG